MCHLGKEVAWKNIRTWVRITCKAIFWKPSYRGCCCFDFFFYKNKEMLWSWSWSVMVMLRADGLWYSNSFTLLHWQFFGEFTYEIKDRSTTFAQLSAYAHWLETHKDRRSNKRTDRQTDGRMLPSANEYKCQIGRNWYFGGFWKINGLTSIYSKSSNWHMWPFRSKVFKYLPRFVVVDTRYPVCPKYIWVILNDALYELCIHHHNNCLSLFCLDKIRPLPEGGLLCFV